MVAPLIPLITQLAPMIISGLAQPGGGPGQGSAPGLGGGILGGIVGGAGPVISNFVGGGGGGGLGGLVGGLFGGGTTGGQEKYLLATFGTGDQGIIRDRLRGCGVPNWQSTSLTLPLSTYGITPAQAMSGCSSPLGGLAGGLGGGLFSGFGPGGIVGGALGSFTEGMPMGGTLRSAVNLRKRMVKCVCRAVGSSRGCR